MQTVGDIILWKNTPSRIHTINKDGNVYLVNENGGFEQVDNDQYEAIEIGEAFLLKNGFTKPNKYKEQYFIDFENGDGFCWAHDKFFVDSKGNTDEFPCEYVDEMQSIFRLYGHSEFAEKITCE